MEPLVGKLNPGQKILVEPVESAKRKPRQRMLDAKLEEQVFEHLLETQKQYLVDCPLSLKTVQTEITGGMLAILFDWLVEVIPEYGLSQETLHLTRNLVDRFLALEKCPRAELQLVGVASLSIAAKMIERFPPSMCDYVYICDNMYTREQVIDKETVILSKLDYRVVCPTSPEFLSLYAHQLDISALEEPRIMFLARYLLDLTVTRNDFSTSLPSTLALAALFLATRQFKTSKDIKGDDASVEALYQVWKLESTSPDKLSSCRRVYAKYKFHQVSKLVPD